MPATSAAQNMNMFYNVFIYRFYINISIFGINMIKIKVIFTMLRREGGPRVKKLFFPLWNMLKPYSWALQNRLTFLLTPNGCWDIACWRWAGFHAFLPFYIGKWAKLGPKFKLANEILGLQELYMTQNLSCIIKSNFYLFLNFCTKFEMAKRPKNQNT